MECRAFAPKDPFRPSVHYSLQNIFLGRKLSTNRPAQLCNTSFPELKFDVPTPDHEMDPFHEAPAHSSPENVNDTPRSEELHTGPEPPLSTGERQRRPHSGTGMTSPYGDIPGLSNLGTRSSPPSIQIPVGRSTQLEGYHLSSTDASPLHDYDNPLRDGDDLSLHVAQTPSDTGRFFFESFVPEATGPDPQTAPSGGLHLEDVNGNRSPVSITDEDLPSSAHSHASGSASQESQGSQCRTSRVTSLGFDSDATSTRVESPSSPLHSPVKYGKPRISSWNSTRSSRSAFGDNALPDGAAGVLKPIRRISHNTSPLPAPRTNAKLEHTSASSGGDGNTTTPGMHQYTLAFILDTIPRQLYLYLLLFLPSLYFSRVSRIFIDSQLSVYELDRCILDEAVARHQLSMPLWRPARRGRWRHVDVWSPYDDLEESWQALTDAFMREWNTLNVISGLLLTAIITILQIGNAAKDPLIRHTALLSMICTLMSLLYGCMYIIRFGTMQKTYKGAEWAYEADKPRTAIFWNVWVMLAMPATWLGWGILMFIVCLASFIWRTGTTFDDNLAPHTPHQVIPARAVVSFILALGIVYFTLVVATLRTYGDVMDTAWMNRIAGWVEVVYEHQRVMQLRMGNGPGEPPRGNVRRVVRMPERESGVDEPLPSSTAAQTPAAARLAAIRLAYGAQRPSELRDPAAADSDACILPSAQAQSRPLPPVPFILGPPRRIRSSKAEDEGSRYSRSPSSSHPHSPSSPSSPSLPFILGPPPRIRSSKADDEGSRYPRSPSSPYPRSPSSPYPRSPPSPRPPSVITLSMPPPYDLPGHTFTPSYGGTAIPSPRTPSPIRSDPEPRHLFTVAQPPMVPPPIPHSSIATTTSTIPPSTMLPPAPPPATLDFEPRRPFIPPPPLTVPQPFPNLSIATTACTIPSSTMILPPPPPINLHLEPTGPSSPTRLLTAPQHIPNSSIATTTCTIPPSSTILPPAAPHVTVDPALTDSSSPTRLLTAPEHVPHSPIATSTYPSSTVRPWHDGLDSPQG